jgi:hypothetical protein
LGDVQSAFSSLTEVINEADVLTIFFAGHGAAKPGSYYLCLRDSDPRWLSTSAMTMVWLLTFVAEVRVRHVNIVLDACESGGAMLDTAGISKRDLIESPGSSSVSFLAASAVNEYAQEENGEGILSKYMLGYISGEKKLQDVRPFLDLVELGRRVSEDMQHVGMQQTPTAWGLNLYGQGEFAANPYFVTTKDAITLVGIPPSSKLGTRIHEYAPELWREYRLIAEEPSPRRLWNILRKIAISLRGEPEHLWSFARGLATTLRARVASSPDLLGEFDVMATCAVGLLPDCDAPGADLALKGFFREISSISRQARVILLERLRENPEFLIKFRSVFGSSFLLPMRLSKTLGWLAASALVDRLSGHWKDEDGEVFKEITDIMAKKYKGSFVAVSDEQAPFLYFFAKSVRFWGGEHSAASIMEDYIDSFVGISGKVARVNLQPEMFLSYVLARAQDFSGVNQEILAQPSQLLSVLLASAPELGLKGHLNSLMMTLDGLTAYAFFPDDYRDFAAGTIENGTSQLYLIGHDLWQVDEFLTLLKKKMDLIGMDPLVKMWHFRALIVLAAYLFPDRVPFFAELRDEEQKFS